MKYLGTLSVTPFQVGTARVVIEGDMPVSSAVVKTRTRVYKDADNNTVEEIKYLLTDFPNRWFPASEVFADKPAAVAYFGTL